MIATIPILRLWDQLVVALQGELTDAQAEELSQRALALSSEPGVRGLIIDVTGVGALDSHLCWVIARIASAAKLMGVSSALCGLSPEVVVTIGAMGIEMKGVTTTASLESALQLVGISPQRRSEVEDDIF